MLYENSLAAFIIITVVLGGGAAWLTGRAIALTWAPRYEALAYMLLLGLAARFLHFALAEGLLLSAYYYAVTAAILAAIAALAYQVTRAWQMETQYPWLYKRTSPISWARVD
ncbi:MAG: DUF6867 family protein [Pseudomonadota bacterium]